MPIREKKRTTKKRYAQQKFPKSDNKYTILTKRMHKKTDVQSTYRQILERKTPAKTDKNQRITDNFEKNKMDVS